MKSEIKCAYRVNFIKLHNIGSLLGFSSNRMLDPQQWHKSINHQHKYHSHWMQRDHGHTTTISSTIHEFSLSVSPGYKISKRSTQIHLLSDHRTEHYGSDDSRCESRCTESTAIKRYDNVKCLFWTNRGHNFCREGRQRSKIFEHPVERNSLHRTKIFTIIGLCCMKYLRWCLEYWRRTNLWRSRRHVRVSHVQSVYQHGLYFWT